MSAESYAGANGSSEEGIFGSLLQKRLERGQLLTKLADLEAALGCKDHDAATAQADLRHQLTQAWR